MKPELRFEEKRMRAAELGEQSCVPDLFGELVLQNQLEFRLKEDDEIFEGYGRKKTAYPYRQYNGYTRELREKEIRTAILENKYLKAVFLPEYGGRLWELWDKETGRNLLYTNDVLRFSNLAVRNAWFSGGVEWNLGVIGHTPLTTESLYVARTTTEKGDPVLRMYEYERIRQVTYQMDFWLEKNSRFLNCRMRIVNESAEVVPMYWWSNIAVKEHEGGRVIVPADEAFTCVDGVVYKVQIPVVGETDITDYKKIKDSVDYFFDIPDESPKYIANVDKNGYGLLHVSTKRLKSRKLFSWGNQDASDRWQEFLTDQAGRYIEIQAGLAPTQYGCIPMAPHTAWEWLEQYGAVQFPEGMRDQEHRERCRYLTTELRRKHVSDKLEKKLSDTRSMARKKAEIIQCGNGYGAMREISALTSHLEFRLEQKSLKNWKGFFDTSVLHCPDAQEVPDEFMINEENLDFLKQSMAEKNSTNWYAYYHLGVGYYIAGKYKKAKKALQESLSIKENPWAYHALSCVYLLFEKNKKAEKAIIKGMKMRISDSAYLKEGFRILSLCQAYKELCDFYKKLDKKVQSINRIRFYYISALHKLGKNKKAFSLLEQDGGLELEDIREGEDSIGLLWQELHAELYGEEGKIPHQYNFKSF